MQRTDFELHCYRRITWTCWCPRSFATWTHTRAMMDTDERTWHVQVEEGEVKVWSLDQLDAAFKAGLIDESTYVLDAGTPEWRTLGTILGGGDEPPQVIAPAPAPAEAAAPRFARANDPSPFSFSPQSTAPMATDLDDAPPAPLRSKKRPVAIGLGIALFAAAVGIFAFTRADRATASAPPPPAVAAVAVAPPAPALPADDSASAAAARLTDSQKRMLAEADKAREDRLAAQQKARAASAPRHAHRSKRKEKGPFQNGGDKYDPLNAKL